MMDEQRDVNEIIDMLTSFTKHTGEYALDRWHSLMEELITKFHDGFRVDDVHVDNIAPRPVFYPFYWLESVGFFPKGGPDYSKTSWSYAIHPPTYSPHNDNKFAEVSAGMQCDSRYTIDNIFVGASLLAVGVYLGYKVGQQKHNEKYIPME